MTDATYNVIFAGQIVNGADPATVRANVAKLFGMEPDKVEALFSGKRVVIKKQADQATAMKLRAVMKQAGAVCELEKIADSESQAAPAISAAAPGHSGQSAPSVQPASTAGVAAGASSAGNEQAAGRSADRGDLPPTAAVGGDWAPAADLQTVGTIRTGGTSFSGPFEVAPSGSELVERQDAPPPVVPDISHLSMAEAGADLEEKKRDQVVNVPDISHISVAPPGADLAD